MLKILLLICPMSMDRAACQPETAIDSARVGMTAMPEQCAFLGMSMSADSTHFRASRTQYLKVVCVRERVASVAR